MVDYQNIGDMGRKKAAFPSYLMHRATGQARIVWAGRTYYLGPHGSPDSLAAYQRMLAEIAAFGQPVERVPGLTVAVLVERFDRWAVRYYGPRSNEPLYHRYATADAVRLYGATPAADFGPAQLKTIRAEWESAGNWSRRTINRRVRQLVRVWAWAVEESLIPPDVWQSLKAVRPLALGRTAAAEYAPIQPAAAADVERTLERLPAAVADLVRFQRLTGCRPGEALGLDFAGVDRSGTVWTYRPACHKTAHHGHSRVIPIGPRAQSILERYPGPRPFAGLYGSVDAYRRAIGRACRRAGVPPWSPNRLRHEAATAIRERFGLETAQAVLGHRSPETTTRYAQSAWELARVAAETLG